MPPIGLHASDTHLRTRLGDEEHAFRQIVSAAVRHDVQYVMLAGDLLDKQSNRAKTIAFFCEQLDILRKHEIAVFYTQGQHDFDDPPWFSAHSHPAHLHKKSRKRGEYVFYGLDWQPFGKLQEELAEIPENVNFLVCHQVWANWMGDVANPQGSFEQVPAHIRFMQTGDLHQWKLKKYKNAGGETMKVLSTGATTQQKIDEPTKHYYGMLYEDGRIEQHPLNSRVMIDSSLMTQSVEVDQFIAELEPMLSSAEQQAAAMDLPDNMYRPYLRVNFSAKLTDVVRRVEKVVQNRAILYFKQTIPEDKQQEYKLSKVASGTVVTPLSVLSDEVNKEEEPATYELVSRLLSASDSAMEFTKWRSEMLGENIES